jgi:hypothetical protein
MLRVSQQCIAAIQLEYPAQRIDIVINRRRPCPAIGEDSVLKKLLIVSFAELPLICIRPKLHRSTTAQLSERAMDSVSMSPKSAGRDHPPKSPKLASNF